MKTEEIALSRLTENEENPRQITKENFAKLVKSIVVFPKMLDIRPVVTDGAYKVLGGNMRTRAMAAIQKMDATEIRTKLDEDGRFTEGEKIAITEYWMGWKENPTVKVVKADDLTEAQKREFIAKDNIGYGSWDYDQLANRWDSKVLQGWGMAVWNDQSLQANPTVPDGCGHGGGSSPGAGAGTGKDDGDGELPPELDGMDLEPDPLDNIEGDEQTPMENIVIKYRREDAEAVARLLGIDEISKIIYRFEDLPSREGGGNGEE